jgi:hypothetical protein
LFVAFILSLATGRVVKVLVASDNLENAALTAVGYLIYDYGKPTSSLHPPEA